MADILITGAGGFIGERLARHLGSSHTVWGLYHEHQPPSSDGDGVRWLKGDITEATLGETLPSAIDVVFHLAQSRFYRDFPDRADDLTAVNIQGTVSVLEWARRAAAKKFIYASSGGIYGGGEKPMAEMAPFGATGDLAFYLATKYCAEFLVRSYAPYFPAVILRPFFVYGPRQRSSMLIPRLVDCVRRETPIILRGELGIRLNPIHVSDAVTAFERAMDLENPETINLAGNEVFTLREITGIIGDHFGIEPVFTIEDSANAPGLVADTALMNRLLGETKIPFSEGIVGVYEG